MNDAPPAAEVVTLIEVQARYGVAAVERYARHLGVEPSDETAGLIARECLSRGLPAIEHFGDCEVLVREIILEGEAGTIEAVRLATLAQVSILGLVWDVRNRTSTPEGGTIAWCRAVRPSEPSDGESEEF